MVLNFTENNLNQPEGLDEIRICKLFEPRGISYLLGVIVRVRVVFRKTVVGD